MASGYQTLTEKEKLTLRLLVEGYDAKSMARHLGLSVHTINERLRDARRKMAVSSSREAARLLREIESDHPEKPVSKDLGDEPAGYPEEMPAAPVGGGLSPRRFGWVVGAIIMGISFALLALASLGDTISFPAPARPEAAASRPAAESAAAQSALGWLDMVDAGDWDNSWQATGASFRALNSAETWARASRTVRVPLGARVSRALVSSEFVPAPPKGYHMIRFKTSFAAKADATETLTLVWEDDAWRVVGYIID
ncbi:MAG: DUF4019 domain-containing protein [Sphingopyxis sp.]|nr:DUF4019 domain-containing protein [Sphingopyxis sp.]